MSNHAERAKAIFLEALEKHSPQEWPALLDQACADDMLLRPEVEKLLGAYVELGSFYERTRPTIPGTSASDIVEGMGAVIGPYRLIEQIGEGGFGAVYLAEQTEPVRRKVALKILKPGMDTRQIVARFEAERQALAIMDHPNIAKVLDGGATPTGRPYFVMDLVKGVPITEFCDHHHLTPRQRLELFIPVCHAVQHAHQKGIIHRDIKPRNVLIAMYDAPPHPPLSARGGEERVRGVPKVIDFGVAKATGQQLSEETLHTGYGAVVGTVEYMSPEQASFNQLDVDTRSDIYSLGVLLYELLTGTTPLKHKQVKQTPVLEVLRMIREDETERPSARLDTVEDLPAVAASRNVEPRKLSGLVRGELDWIVMKALEKNRDRRYETADGLAADIQRYLDNEPVQACPPSTAYRFRKFASRNKVALATGALIAVLLIVTSTVLGVSNVRIDQALGDKTEALKQRGRAFDDLEKQQKKVTQALDDVTKLLAKLKEEQKQTKQALYFHSIALADREWSLNNVDKAEEILDQCPVEPRDWEWHFLKRRCRIGVTLFQGQNPRDRAAALAFSPDGDRLAACLVSTREPSEAIDRGLRIWDVKSGKELLRKTMDIEFQVRQFAFAPDGSRIVIPITDPQASTHAVEILNAQTGATVLTIPGHVLAAAYSPGGEQLALVFANGIVNLCDANTGQIQRTLPVPKGSTTAVHYSPDGKRLVTGGLDRAVRVWNVATGQELFQLRGHNDAIEWVEYSPDGRRLATVTRDGWRVFNAETGENLWSITGESRLRRSAALSPDSRHMLVTDLDRSLRMLDAESGKEIHRLRSRGSHVLRIAWSRTGYVATTTEDGQLILRQATGPIVLNGRPNVNPLALSGDGRTLVCSEVLTGKTPANRIVLDIPTGRVKARLAGATTFATGISRDGALLAGHLPGTATKFRGALHIWESDGGRVSAALRDVVDQVNCVAFRGDGKRLAIGHRQTLAVWDLDSRKEVYSVPTEGPNTLAFSPNGRYLAGIELFNLEEYRIKLWDAATGTVLRAWTFPGRPISARLAFSSDSQWLASGGPTETVSIFRVPDQSPGPALVVPGRQLAFSSNPTRVATWGFTDQAIKLWDLKTGREVLAIREGPTHLATFGEDGIFTTVDTKGNVRQYDGRRGLAWR